MLNEKTKEYLSHAASEYMRARAEGHPVIIVIRLADGLDEHDVYALLAINAEDPSVDRIGLSMVTRGEYDLAPDGHIDWNQES